MLTIRTNCFKQTVADIIRVQLIESIIRFPQRRLNLIPQDIEPKDNGNTGKSTDKASNLIKIKITSEKIPFVVLQTRLITPRMMVPVFRSKHTQAFSTVGNQV